MSFYRAILHVLAVFVFMQLSGCVTSGYTSATSYTAADRFEYQRRVASLSMERRNYTGASYVDSELERARAAHRRQINSQRLKREKRRGGNGPDERQRELAEYRRVVESLRLKRR